jgi:hypothetical protein
MPPLSRRSLLATVTAGAASSVAGCNALSRHTTPDASRDGFSTTPLYVADGVPLPDGVDVITVDDPVGGDVALFPADLSDMDKPLSALDGATPVAFVGRKAQAPLMDLCAADGRSYGFSSNGWGPETRVAAAVPLGDSLGTHTFEGNDVPSALPRILDRLLNPPRPQCSVDSELSALPDGFDDRARTVGSSYLYGRNGVARFVRRDTVRVAPGPDRTAIVVDITGTIYAGSQVGGDGSYVADQVRLVTSFDDRLQASAPPAADTDDLAVQRDLNDAEDTVEHRFTPTTKESRQQFTACQHSLVTAPEPRNPFTYTANCRFRWRNPRFVREDDHWHHHTPGVAMWYPDGGR